MRLAFQIHPADNVATLLDDAGAEAISILSTPQPLDVTLARPVAMAHKVAVSGIADGESIVKQELRTQNVSENHFYGS